MKKAFVSAAVAVLLVMAGQGCSPSPPPGIIRVLNERALAVKASEEKPKDGHRQFNMASYSRLLRQIGSDDCPRDFTLAWGRYKHAWGERETHIFDRGLGVETELAWGDVKKQCVIFNIPLPSETVEF